MLARSHYPQGYIDACRAKVNLQHSAYRGLVAAAQGMAGVKGETLHSAIGALEPVFFNNMLLALDGYFVHRTRAVEKKDGNPLNEVRMMCDSMMNNDDVLRADNTIKYDPPTSVLKHRIGDEIRLNEEAFQRICEAFFADIEAKFVAT